MSNKILSNKLVTDKDPCAALMTHSSTEASEEQPQLSAYQTWKVATTTFLWVSIATIVSPMFTFFNTVFAGRLTTEELASYGLGASVIAMFATALCITFSVGQMSLTSQAFGAGNIRECIVIRNKSLYLVTLIYAVLFFFFLSSEDILIALGVKEQIAAGAGTFVRTCTIGFYFEFVFQVYAIYFFSQELVKLPTLVLILSTVVHVVVLLMCNSLFNNRLMAIGYATLANFASRGVTAIALDYLLTDLPYKHKDVLLFSKETFTDVTELAKAGFASLVMLLPIGWLLEILTFMTTFLSDEEMAAMTVLRSYNLVLFALPVAFQASTAVLTGMYVGNKNAKNALTNYYVTLVNGLFIGSLLLTVLWIFQDIVIGTFTSLEEVKVLVFKAIPIFYVYMLACFTQFISMGMINGSGRQVVGASITLVGYWVIGIPLSYVLVFQYDKSLVGIFAGSLIASIFINVCLLLVNLNSNWEKIINKALEIQKKSQQKLSDQGQDFDHFATA